VDSVILIDGYIKSSR